MTYQKHLHGSNKRTMENRRKLTGKSEHLFARMFVWVACFLDIPHENLIISESCGWLYATMETLETMSKNADCYVSRMFFIYAVAWRQNCLLNFLGNHAKFLFLPPLYFHFT